MDVAGDGGAGGAGGRHKSSTVEQQKLTRSERKKLEKKAAFEARLVAEAQIQAVEEASVVDDDNVLSAEERQVAELTDCWDMQMLRDALLDTEYDIEQAVNQVLFLQTVAAGNADTSVADPNPRGSSVAKERIKINVKKNKTAKLSNKARQALAKAERKQKRLQEKRDSNKQKHKVTEDEEAAPLKILAI